MKFLRDLSFPHKIIALILAVFVVGGGIYAAAVLVRGTIHVHVPYPNAMIQRPQDEASAVLPQTYRLRPGRYRFIISAPGYLSRHVRLPVYAFLTRTHTVPLFRDVTTEQETYRIEYDESRDTVIIVPKIDFTALDSPLTQIEKQWDTYDRYAKEALSYIRARGVDPKALTIEWWGYEWWPKGKKVTVE